MFPPAFGQQLNLRFEFCDPRPLGLEGRCCMYTSVSRCDLLRRCMRLPIHSRPKCLFVTIRLVNLGVPPYEIQLYRNATHTHTQRSNGHSYKLSKAAFPTAGYAGCKVSSLCISTPHSSPTLHLSPQRCTASLSKSCSSPSCPSSSGNSQRTNGNRASQTSSYAAWQVTGTQRSVSLGLTCSLCLSMQGGYAMQGQGAEKLHAHLIRYVCCQPVCQGP